MLDEEFKTLRECVSVISHMMSCSLMAMMTVSWEANSDIGCVSKTVS